MSYSHAHDIKRLEDALNGTRFTIGDYVLMLVLISACIASFAWERHIDGKERSTQVPPGSESAGLRGDEGRQNLVLPKGGL